LAKIIALYINELIKISKKISVYIILIVMLVGMFLTGGLLKYSQDRMKSQTTNTNSASFMKDDMQSRLTNLQSQLATTNTQIASASPEQKKLLDVDVTNLGYQIDSLNTAITMNVYLYTTYYIAQAIQDLCDYKTEANNLAALPAETLTQAQKDVQTLLASLIPRMDSVITNKSFKDYTSIINEKLSADTGMSQTDKDIQLEQNNLRLKHNVTNEDKNSTLGRFQISMTSDDVINNIGIARRSLANNLDFSASQNAPIPLTSDRRAQITDDVTVYLKQLDTGAIQTNNFSLMGNVIGVGIFMIELLLLILAGGAISQELSTGSIKSLIISPTKRWKIYVAKLLSLITVGVIAAIICYFIGMLVYGVFFGLSSVSPYIYASSGNAILMNFYLFTFAKLFIGLIEVAFYMVLALMLSTITRNTAASVGISIGVLFGGIIAYTILTNLLTGEWLKFLPFANFDFSSKIFTFDPSIAASSSVNTTIAFSTIYIIITLCLMFYIGLDSFNRRDIK
jgi:ABC-2 type transport system permease protein